MAKPSESSTSTRLIAGESLFVHHTLISPERDIFCFLIHSIAATPTFPGLRHFHNGRRYKQWTGDDSKGLMKVCLHDRPNLQALMCPFIQVYLPALSGLVDFDVIKAIASFLDFCYIARRQDLNEDSLKALERALKDFHKHREIFRTSGVRPDGFGTLPRQHSVIHYRHHITEFGAPNGLCSSITESRHITAVKKPWRRSNRCNALGQMLLTNQRLDKLAASFNDFVARSMLPPRRTTNLEPNATQTHDDDGGPVDEERVTGHVVLARTPSTSLCSGCSHTPPQS